MFHKIVDHTVYVGGTAKGDCLYGAISTRVKEDRAGWRRWSRRRRKCFAWGRTGELKPEIAFEARIINISARTCKTNILVINFGNCIIYILIFKGVEKLDIALVQLH